MKTFMIALCSLFSIAASAGNGFDGCYQLYRPGVLLPAICLQGTLEEGIAGSGVRLAVFGAGTNLIEQCLKSTSVSFQHDSFVFEINGQKELILDVLQTENGRKSGNAVIGNTHLRFSELNATDTARLLKIASSRCR